MPPINMAGLVDMNQVLDEMWVVAQDEMNFLAEAANMEEFARLNKNVAFVTSRCCIGNIRPPRCW